MTGLVIGGRAAASAGRMASRGGRVGRTKKGSLIESQMGVHPIMQQPKTIMAMPSTPMARAVSGDSVHERTQLRTGGGGGGAGGGGLPPAQSTQGPSSPGARPSARSASIHTFSWLIHELSHVTVAPAAMSAAIRMAEMSIHRPERESRFLGGFRGGPATLVYGALQTKQCSLCVAHSVISRR